MDELFCKKCGRAITDGWVSKSGYCHPCASEIRMERERERKSQKAQNFKKRWWILPLIVVLLMIPSLFLTLYEKHTIGEALQYFRYVGTIEETKNAVYACVVETKTDFSEYMKRKLCTSIYDRDKDEKPDTQIVTILIIDANSQEIYQAFTKFVNSDTVYDLDDDLALAGFALAQDAG